MKTDKHLRADVEAELAWDPAIDAANVGVAVHGGIVTLTGHLNTLAEKAAIEHVVSRVAGVAAVAVELDVRLLPDHLRTDAEIAQAVDHAITWNALLPRDKITIKVERAVVTLSGEVDWEYQRQAAAEAVRPLTGVRALANLIALKPRSRPRDIGARIGDALARRARRDAAGVQVRVLGSTIFLSGEVQTRAERDAALGAAWSAPGVNDVISEVTIKQ